MKKDFRFRLTGVLTALAVIAGLSAAAMLLWNTLAPNIFDAPTLNYWQAAGILVLARILFGGLMPGYFMPRRGFNFLHGNNPREKWIGMNAEERAAFVEREKDFHNLFRDRLSRLHQFYGETGANGGHE